jgi:hypothetical protein
MGYDDVADGGQANAPPLSRSDVMPATGRAWEMPEGVRKSWRGDGWRELLLPADHADLQF